MMQLNESNYYSREADNLFCSNSLVNTFRKCEKRALKYLDGEFAIESTEAQILGNYVDTMLLGTEKEKIEFPELHPEMYSSRGATKGLLKSNFQRAEQMIKVAQSDPRFMGFLGGEHQRIMTGELFGVPFKIKMDCYHEHKMIVDLKTTESATKGYWNKDLRCYETFIEYFGYIQQLAIYQEIVRQNTGETLPCLIAYISKEPITDHDLIYIDNETLHDCLFGSEVEEGLSSTIVRIGELMRREVEPVACGVCDLCMSEKKVTKPIHYTELMGRLN